VDGLAKRLQSRSLFKFIVGMTNFDLAELRFLTQVYTLAGADIIDIAAEPEMVVATRQAMAAIGEQWPSAAGLPRIMVSAALAQDPHIEGVPIEDEHRAAVAPASAAELAQTVAACLDEGAEMVELHASDSDDESLKEAVRALSSLLGDRYLSVCLGTQGLRSPRDVIRQARLVRAIHGSRTMIQAEGLSATRAGHPASSLQGMALAQALLAHTSVYVLVAGGANHWTRSVADMLGIPVHGVAVGSYARALVKGFQATHPQGEAWEPVAQVARAFVGQMRGSVDRAV
jgi:hypothetical protein